MDKVKEKYEAMQDAIAEYVDAELGAKGHLETPEEEPPLMTPSEFFALFSVKLV